MAEIVKAAWLNAGSYLAREDRSVIRALRAWTGVVNYNDLKVTAMATPDMRTQVAPGRCIVDGTESPASQGSYAFAPPDTKTLTHAASTTLPRNDIVGVRVYDADFSGAVYDCEREIVQGTPNASPVDPTRPANWMDLARVRVRANTTSILNSDITDLRERNDLRSFYCKVHQGTGGQQVTFNGAWFQITASLIVDSDPSGMFSSPNIIAPVSGWYLIEHRCSMNAANNTYWLGSGIWTSGSYFLAQDLRKFDSTWPFAGIAGSMVMRWLSKGTIIGLYIWQNLGASGWFTYSASEADWCQFSATLIGA